MAGKQARAKVRLRLDRGTALLKQLGVSSVMCAILDLSENGCLCRISLADVDDETAASWRKLINPGRILTLEVTEPSELRHLQFNEAEVRWVKAAPENCLDFGLLLKNLEPEQVLTLNQAMMTLASLKLRKAAASTPGATVSAPAPRVSVAPPPSAAKPQTKLDDFLPLPSDAPAMAPPLPGAPAAPKATRPVAASTPPAVPAAAPTETSHRPKTQSTVKLPAPKGLTASGRWKLSAGIFTPPKGTPVSKRVDPHELPRLDASNLERQKRQALNAPVFYQFRDERNQPPDQETYEGRTIDFNEGGFQIEGPLPQTIAEDQLTTEKWTVVCIIQVGGHELATKCRARSLTPGRADDLRMWGLQIIDMPEEDRRILRELYIRAGLTMVRRR